eukprot:XP_025984192.1 DNA mismatch repair protein MSH5 [Glycine max]
MVHPPRLCPNLCIRFRPILRLLFKFNHRTMMSIILPGGAEAKLSAIWGNCFCQNSAWQGIWFCSIWDQIWRGRSPLTRDLFSHILLFQTYLIKVATFAVELDNFLLMALARQNNYVRPLLTEENLLDIKNGRHVLQEMTIDTFIPNDTKILHDGK